MFSFIRFSQSLLRYFFLILLRPRISTLFPYTTLFRSLGQGQRRAGRAQTAAVPPMLLFDTAGGWRSEEHTLNSSHLGISYAVFCLKKKTPREIEQDCASRSAIAACPRSPSSALLLQAS